MSMLPFETTASPALSDETYAIAVPS